MTALAPEGHVRRRAVGALAAGALAVGVLDIGDALVFYGVEGASPALVFHSIASGLLGRAAFAGGLPTALLGLVLHFCIATVIVLVYYAAARRAELLWRRPGWCGAAYGLVVYAVMYGLVLPLSAHGPAHYAVASVADELAAHVFLVGMPAAFFVRAAVAPPARRHPLSPSRPSP